MCSRSLHLHPIAARCLSNSPAAGHTCSFWATWCAPCKASLPEVVAFERESGVPVVAITDEPPEKLDAFFAKYNGPFPAIVAVDELRRAFLAYGVSGTPTSC